GHGPGGHQARRRGVLREAPAAGPGGRAPPGDGRGPGLRLPPGGAEPAGGEALVYNRCLGRISSRRNQSDKSGYIIPGEEIDLFLKDVADGKYDGKPAMNEPLQTLENDSLRQVLALAREA